MHIQIVANIALKLLRQLTKHGVEPSVVRDYGMTNDDAEVVVVLAALMHCVGMSVHRRGHEDFSLFLSEPKMRELLDGIYDEPERTVVISEVLQAITSHRADGEPLALEAGHPPRRRRARHGEGPLAHPVRGAARSRCTRSRRPRSTRSRSRTASEKPVRIEILMNNSSGLFQVDGLLKAKLRGSGLEPYVEVIAHIDTENEKRLVPVYRLEPERSPAANPPRPRLLPSGPSPAGSSNGRTPDSGSGSWGSSPCPAASESPRKGAFLVAR